MSNYTVTLDDIKGMGFTLREISAMFNNEIGVQLHAAISNVPSKEVLEMIFKQYQDKNDQIKKVEDVSLELDVLDELPEELIEDHSDVQMIDAMMPTPEKVEKIEEPIIVNEPAPKKETVEFVPPPVIEPVVMTKPVPEFIEIDKMSKKGILEQFKAQNSRVYQVVLPLSGGTASVKPTTLSALDALNGSTMFSEFGYYKSLLNILYSSITENSLGINSYNDFLDKVSVFDIDEILFGVYRLMYGDDTEYSLSCKKCNHKITTKLLLETIRNTPDKVVQLIGDVLHKRPLDNDFKREVTLDSLNLIIGIDLPKIKHQIIISEFLESKDLNLDGSLYKFLLHISHISVKLQDGQYVKYDDVESIFEYVEVLHTQLDKLSTEIDEYRKLISSFKANIVCPECGTTNVAVYDIKTDFLIKALSN